MRIKNNRGSRSKRQRPDENFLTELQRSSTHIVKRSISGKFPSKVSTDQKAATRKLALASKLRLNPKSVEAKNAYFGIVKRRKKANDKRKRKPGKEQKGKDKTLQESTGPETVKPTSSRTKDGTTPERTTDDSNAARAPPKEKGLMLAGVIQ